MLCIQIFWVHNIVRRNFSSIALIIACKCLLQCWSLRAKYAFCDITGNLSTMQSLIEIFIIYDISFFVEKWHTWSTEEGYLKKLVRDACLVPFLDTEESLVWLVLGRDGGALLGLVWVPGSGSHSSSLKLSITRSVTAAREWHISSFHKLKHHVMHTPYKTIVTGAYNWKDYFFAWMFFTPRYLRNINTIEFICILHCTLFHTYKICETSAVII